MIRTVQEDREMAVIWSVRNLVKILCSKIGSIRIKNMFLAKKPVQHNKNVGSYLPNFGDCFG